MKRFFLLVSSFSIALAGALQAQDQDQPKEVKTKPKAVQPARRASPQQNGPSVNRKPAPPNRANPKTRYPAEAYNPTTRNAHYPPGAYNPKTRNTEYQAEAYNPTTRRDTFLPKPAPAVQTDPGARHDDRQNPDWQNRAINHNPRENDHSFDWRNRNHPRTESWAEVRRRHHHEYHDHHWWRSHYTRFALFGTGYFFWDAGYWYPAYGYDPAYNTYEYEEPIYAPTDADPSEVIANVQTQLQQLGYYPYDADGLMGPDTRNAISNYQRDNGLDITSAIDQPTLESLGLE